jgi:hypothetical protein
MQTSKQGARMIINARPHQVSQVPTPQSRSTPMMHRSDMRVHQMIMNPFANHKSET